MRRLATLAVVIAAAALTAAGQAFTITTQSLPSATVGQPYGPVLLETAGDPGPIVWNFTAGGGPPNGFVVGPSPSLVGQPTPTTGILCWGTAGQGTPACGGSISNNVPPSVYQIFIQATSVSTSRVATMQYSFSVLGPLQIVTTSLKTAFANQTYSDQIQAQGGSGKYTWSIVNGSLPPGITLDQGGFLSGTAPGISAVYPFTVQIADQTTQATATQTLSITVTGGLEITTVALRDAIVNQSYSFQLQAVGSQTLVWTVLSGFLPPGFSLSADGVLTGFPLNPGQFQFRIQVSNPQFEGALTTSRLYVLNVTLGPLGIDCALCPDTTALPNVSQNVPFSVLLTGVGGIPPYTWSFGTPKPPALNIDLNGGVISGTVTTSTGFQVPVVLTDSVGTVFSKTFNLRVNTAVTITTTSLPNAPPGVPYSATVAATGGSFPFQWSVSAGDLPPGLTLKTANNIGQISGTPTTQGTFQFTLQVSDYFGSKDTKAFTIVVGPVLTITTTSLSDGVLNAAYLPATLAATGGTGSLTWSIASGTLPPGLQLNGDTISGTPTTAGNFTFDVQVSDAARGAARKTLTIKVPLLITTGDLSGPVLTPFSQTLTATGGTPKTDGTYTWSSSSLPGGLQLNSATGVISGTPGGAGTTQVAVTATDVNGLTGTKTINITILQPLPPATSISVGTTTQPAVGLTLGAGYASEITGFLTLTFSGTDDMVRFIPSGTRSLEYIVRANTTTAIFPTTANPAIVTGTVAGTITLTASMFAGGQNITPNPPPTKTIVIDPAVPVITGVTLQQVTGGLNVVVTGYSNTREVSSGSFTFTVSSGNTLSQSQITVQLTSAYAAWFGSTASNATGGQFKLTVPFSVTQGAATAVTKVGVTLTNSKGTSAAVSSP